MREIHIAIRLKASEPPLNADDLDMQHVTEDYAPNDPNATQIKVTEPETCIVVHWADGIPMDEDTRIAVEDAILRSLGM